MRGFSSALLAVGGLASMASASPSGMKGFPPGRVPMAIKSGRPMDLTSHAVTSQSCDTTNTPSTKAPLPNIFAPLSADDSAAVTKFLHEQSELNLTANANATRFVRLLLSFPFLRGFPRVLIFCRCCSC